MAKYIHNLSEENITYQGREVEADEFFLIPAEVETDYMSDAQLIADLANGVVKMSANGTSDLNGNASAQVDFLKGIDLSPRDSDGSLLQRIKVTTSGWHFQLHGIEFETSKLSSIHSKKVDNTDYGFTTAKFYEDVEGVETLITGEDLTQEYLDANCIKTVIDWEATHDLEIIGGTVKQKSIPSEDLRVWVVGVPDVPAEYGGSKPFVINANLSFIGLEEGIKVDGRAPKFMTYSATYHTNKLSLIFRHSAGFKHKLHMIFELFKA